MVSDSIAPVQPPPDVEAAALTIPTRFRILNSNDVDCTIQRDGTSPVVVPARQWSPTFWMDGKYDVFVTSSLVQFTVYYVGGEMKIVPVRGGGNYVVWTSLV